MHDQSRSGAAYYTPTEYDFCACGGTFQPINPGQQKRWCGSCSRPEGERRSWHERTGTTYQNLLPDRSEVANARIALDVLEAQLPKDSGEGLDSSRNPASPELQPGEVIDG
jgi:hypothetical protein